MKTKKNKKRIKAPLKVIEEQAMKGEDVNKYFKGGKIVNPLN